MKKFLIALSVLALLLIAGPIQADWIDDIGITSNTNFIGANFSGSFGIVTLKTKSGNCVQYKIVGEEVVATRECNIKDWKEFIKK